MQWLRVVGFLNLIRWDLCIRFAYLRSFQTGEACLVQLCRLKQPQGLGRNEVDLEQHTLPDN